METIRVIKDFKINNKNSEFEFKKDSKYPVFNYLEDDVCVLVKSGHSKLEDKVCIPLNSEGVLYELINNEDYSG